MRETLVERNIEFLSDVETILYRLPMEEALHFNVQSVVQLKFMEIDWIKINLCFRPPERFELRPVTEPNDVEKVYKM